MHSVWTELRVGDVLSVMAKPTGVSSEMRESKVKGSVKSARQVISNETEEEHEEAKQAPEYKRMYPTTTSKTTREDILPNQNPGFILAVENVILTGRDAFYAKGIKQLIDDGEGHRWNTPSFDACHWHTTSIVSTRHHQIAKNNGEDSNSDSYSDSVLCDSELPATWGTDQWEFSKGARYIWGPDKSAKMLFLRTTIGETCMTPVTSTTSSTNGSPGSNAVGSGSTNQQQQGKGEQDGTIPKQIPISESVLMVSVSGQADIYINGLLIRRLSSSSCHSVTQIVVPHSAALGTASFYTGAVIGIHAIVKPSRHRNHPLHFTSTSSTTRGSSSVIDGAQGGIIVAAGPQLVMTGRDPVRVLSRNEVSALGFQTSLGRTHLWASDQYDACSWHVATTLSVFADGNQWCRPDSFGTKEKGWPFPREARYVWHPDRTERDVFMRVTIGGDEDKCAKQMARLSGRTDATVGVVKGLRQREQYYSGDRDGVVVDQMKTELVKGVEQERDLRTPGSLNGYYISSAADKFMKEERYMRQNVQSLPHPVITRGWACSASGTLPVLFSTPGTAKLYVNGHHIATHRNGLAHPDACQSHTTAYIRAKHGTVVTFYVTGAAQASALGLVAAIGGWYVTGHDQRWRMSHARRAHNWISPEYDACHDFGDQQMIVTDKIRCKAKTLPRELDAQYVWSTTRTEFLYVRLSIGESCAA